MSHDPDTLALVRDNNTAESTQDHHHHRPATTDKLYITQAPPFSPQVTCGPTTADPMDVSGTSGPIKGKLLVPLTEAEKAEKRRRKAKGVSDTTGHSQGSRGPQTTRKAPQGSSGTLPPEAPSDPDPVEFSHILTAGRNYTVLQVAGGMSHVVGARSCLHFLFRTRVRGNVDTQNVM